MDYRIAKQVKGDLLPKNRLFVLLRVVSLPGIVIRGLVIFISILLMSELVAAAPQRVEVRMAQTTPNVVHLELDQPIETEIRQGEKHEYQIMLQAGQSLRILVQQREIDVAITLLGPDGKVIIAVDESEEQELEKILVTVDLTGKYRLLVEPYNQSAPLGRYQVIVKKFGLPEELLDTNRLALEGIVKEGLRLHREGTLESLQQAITKLEQAVSLSEQIGDRLQKASILTLIGSIYSDLNEYQQALNYLDQALTLIREVGDKNGEAVTLNNIGKIYYALGELQQALNYQKQALPLRRMIDDKKGEATTLNNIGVVYNALGENQKAVDYLNQSLPLFREVGDIAGEAATLNNIGLVYDALGEKQKALDYLNQSLPLRRQVGDKAGEATTLNNIGAVYSDLGEKQKALDYYNQSLPLRRQVGDKAGEALTLYNFAYVERDRGNLNQALTHIESAIKIIEELRLKIGSQQLRASYFAENQNYYEFYIDLLMHLHKTNPSQGYDAKALHASERSKARSLLELLTEANANIRQGVNPRLLEQERNLQQQLNAAEQSRFQLLQGQYTDKELDNIKQQIEDISTQLQRVEGEIRINSPRYASLKYPQPLTLPEIQQQVLDDNTILLEYSLGEERSYLWVVTKTGFTSYELPKRADIEAAAKAFYEQVKSPEMSSPEEGMKLSQMLLAPVANQLGNKRLLIVGDGAVQYIPFAALPIPGNIKMSVSDSLRQGNKNFIDESIGVRTRPEINFQRSQAEPWELGESLLKLTSCTSIDNEAEPRYLVPRLSLGMRVGRLCLPMIENAKQTNFAGFTVGFNRLKLLAWDLNPRRVADTNELHSYTPLLVQNEIVTLPSASTIAILRKEIANRTPAPKALVVIADPVFNRNDSRFQSKSAQKSNTADSTLTRSIFDVGLELDRLQYTRQEAEAILALVPENQRTSALDFAASRSTATNSNLSQYRIVHFATHGLVNSTRPELSGVVLSLINEKGEDEDGFLRLNDIFNLNLPAELVVLSACQTGLGKEIKGEGLIGLTRGFMYAGAKDVAVSLWSVNDAGTSELMKRFYQQMLEKKLNPVAAMRAAQLEMMRSQKWNAPYYWAAFVVQGEWR